MKLLKRHTFFTILLFLVSTFSNGQELKLGLPAGHTDYVTNVFYSPSGKFLFSTSNDFTSKIWDVKEGKLITNTPYSKNSKEFGFVSDSIILLRNNEFTASLYNIKTQKIFLEIKSTNEIRVSKNHFKYTQNKLNYVKLDKSKKNVIGVYDNSTVQVINTIDKSKIELVLKVKKVIDVKVSDNQKTIGFNSDKGKITILNVSNEILFEKKVNGLKDFLFTGVDTIAVLNDNSITLWNYRKNIKIKKVQIDYSVIDFQIPEINSKIFFFNKFNSLNEFDIKTGNVSMLGVKENNPIKLLKVESNLDRLYYATSDSLKVLKLISKSIVYKKSFNTNVQNIKLHTKSKSYSVFKNNTIRNYDLANGKLISILKNQIQPILFASIDPVKQKLYYVNRDLKEYTLSLGSGKFESIDEPKIEFTNTPYTYTISKILSNKGIISDASSIINKLYSKEKNKIFFNKETGTLNTKIPINNFGKRFRSRSKSKNDFVSLYHNNYLRIGTNKNNISVQLFQPSGRSSFYKLGNHNGLVNSLDSFENRDNTVILSSSEDGSLIIWNINSIKKGKVITYYIFNSDPKKWVHIHPSGLFDASPEAMEMMYWTKGLEVIEFSQLKEKYYMPGLWEKVMKGEYLGNVDIKRDGIQLQPEVALGKIENNILPITLIKREGGYGELSVFLNGKEIIKDARPKNFNNNLKKQTINLDISQFNHLTKNGENKFTVKVKNKSGDVQSRGTNTKSNVKKEFKPPSFYGLFIGINDYVGDIDLKYPVPDVNAMYNALELGAQNLFGKEKTHLYKLTTDTESKPRKEIIQNKLKEIADKANPEDVLFIYLSGHGLTWTDNNNQSDFYFLTEDARFANKGAYNDKDTREQTAISTNEWVEYIKKIAANKTVMVIDACGSGQAVENLIASRDIESNQIKAVDRMKDRTGMFVISGSAADRVSYEASKYGQGLLTYTLLKAMSGVALKENKNIDVSTLFNYAKDQVPFLAKDIGGIQEPQVLFPKSGSFDLGILNSKDQSKIEIKEPKDVYVRSTLINADELEDNLDLSSLLDEQLNNSSSKTRGKEIIWVDAKKYVNGCKISGSYTQNSNSISLNFKIKCKNTQTKHQVSGATKEEIIKLILEKL